MSHLTPDLPTDFAQLHPSAFSAPFWEAAREHRFVVQFCSECGAARMPPGPYCWSCQSAGANWVELDGHGTVYSYTVTRHAAVPELAEAVPFAVAVVDLDDAPGARLVAMFVGVDPDDVHIGMRVAVVWDDVLPGATIPRITALT